MPSELNALVARREIVVGWAGWVGLLTSFSAVLGSLESLVESVPLPVCLSGPMPFWMEPWYDDCML